MHQSKLLVYCTERVSPRLKIFTDNNGARGE